jgi:hypothetical protein
MSNLPMTWAALQQPAPTKKCSGCATFKPLAVFRDPVRGKELKTCASCRGYDQQWRFKPTVDDAEVSRLNAAYRTWQGGEPHDWPASFGVVCWNERRMAA